MVVLQAGTVSSRDQTFQENNNLDHEGVIQQSEIKMELTSGVFEARHGQDNTEVLLALLTQNKELEGNFFIFYVLDHHI